MLDRKGNSNTQERMDLLDDWQQLFAQRHVQCLTADREFMREQWFEYLMEQTLIPLRIRIRESDKLSNGRTALKGKVVFPHLKPKQTQVLKNRRCLWGHWVYVAALKLEDGKLLIVATAHAPKTAISDDAHRWGIETLFGIFKTRGFILESNHLQDLERLSKLFALLTLALCWAFRTGYWLHQLKPLKLKELGRRTKSIFRYGFDHLRGIVLNLDQRADEFREVLPFLSCT